MVWYYWHSLRLKRFQRHMLCSPTTYHPSITPLLERLWFLYLKLFPESSRCWEHCFSQLQSLVLASLALIVEVVNMAISRIVHLLPLVLLLSVSVAATALQPVTQIRTPAGVSVRDTYNAIRRSLAAASLERRQEYKAEVPLARSWQDASLIEL